MIRDLSAVFFALAFTVAASQVPAYIQQYEQRLGGAVDELSAIVTHDEERLVGKGVSSTLLTGQGMKEIGERLTRLRAAQAHLNAAGPLHKPVVFVRTFDPYIAKRTWEKFEFTLTLSLPYAAAGLLIGLLCHGGATATARRVRRRRQRPNFR